MKNIKHTSGPWKVAKCHPNNNFSVYATGPLLYTEKESDASLIAASPDMFDALQSIVDAFGDQDCILMDQCKAALCKAKGEKTYLIPEIK